MSQKLRLTESQMCTLRFAIYTSWENFTEEEKIDAQELLRKINGLIEKETGGDIYE